MWVTWKKCTYDDKGAEAVQDGSCEGSGKDRTRINGTPSSLHIIRTAGSQFLRPSGSN